MIKLENISKSFDGYAAVSDLTLRIKEGQVFGMIGTNGAGKSTVLRMMSGVLKPDSGEVTLDELPVFENVKAKQNLFFIADDPYFFGTGNPADMAAYIGTVYGGFDQEKFKTLLERFNLDYKRKISTFSKGMKKQVSILLGLCANTKYLYLDETFDGLDPVMRQGVKSLLAKEMEERGLTPVIASHNLRELEDICDSVGLLHKGGVILEKDLEELKDSIQKVQAVFPEDFDIVGLKERLDIIKEEERGRLRTWVLRGTKEAAEKTLKEAAPVFYEVLPLTLEEIFISETNVIGYDLHNIIYSEPGGGAR
ncbi:MAG: ABC transporter ATP-binding protein [Lachnospiraceae bacterium]|nr:ABC transporter ATP-binding protein [Lachnospiraceae bacterium]